jgi:hypothetical protein
MDSIQDASGLSAENQNDYNPSFSDHSHQPTRAIQFFGISLSRLVLLSFLTVGFYIIYWFYRNWVAVKKAEQSNIWPFWRAFFSIFFGYSLFKRINQSIKSHSPKRKFSPSFLAFLYILFFSLQKFGLIFFDLIPLTFVQKAINFNNKQIDPNYKPIKTFALGEKLLIVLGICLWLGGIYRVASERKIDKETSLSNWQIHQSTAGDFKAL